MGLNLNPARLHNETFEEYKLRQKNNKKFLKLYLRGTLYWDSSTKGTLQNNKGKS
ncbi:MAG: hypothetical protein AB7O96_00885 [Pseudobdellovibrionaceae bacterium]